MYKRFSVGLILFVLIAALSACSNGSNVEPSSAPTTVPNSSTDTLQDSQPETSLDSKASASSEQKTDSVEETLNVAQENHILIAYFSWSGNTKQLAEEIQCQTGGDLFEIIPTVPYTDDINELSGISLQEQRDNIRPELSSHVENMEQYGIVFVGYPNWWSNAPMPVFTFLEEYDFSGKTVIPFSTYGNGGFGKSVQSIEDAVSGATLLEGLAIQEHELETASAQVTEWLQELSLEP